VLFFVYLVGDSGGIGVSRNGSKVLLKEMRYSELEVCMRLCFLFFLVGNGEIIMGCLTY
jgi:hypothetical protein